MNMQIYYHPGIADSTTLPPAPPAQSGDEGAIIGALLPIFSGNPSDLYEWAKDVYENWIASRVKRPPFQRWLT